MGWSIKTNQGEIKALLEGLPASIARAVTRKAMLEGAKVFAAEAKRRVVRPKGRSRRKQGGSAGASNPVGTWSTGRLSRAIKAKVFPIRDRSKAVRGRMGSSTVGYFAATYIDNKKIKNRNARRYAHLVEYGTAPHKVGKGSNNRKRGNQTVVQVGGLHPGAKKQEFMRPAFDQMHKRALEVVAEETRREIPKQVKKRAARKRSSQ